MKKVASGIFSPSRTYIVAFITTCSFKRRDPPLAVRSFALYMLRCLGNVIRFKYAEFQTIFDGFTRHVQNARISASKWLQLFISSHTLIVCATFLTVGVEAIKQQRSSYHSIIPMSAILVALLIKRSIPGMSSN